MNRSGQKLGEEALRGGRGLRGDIARRCAAKLREDLAHDRNVGGFGEEFAVVLPETGQVGAKVIAQRLRRGIEQLQIRQGGQSLSVTVSIGMASTDMANLETAREALIAQSDRALYRAKRNGRNRLEI